MSFGEKSAGREGRWFRNNTQRGIVLVCWYCAGICLAVFCWRNSRFRAPRIPTANVVVQSNELGAFGFGRLNRSGSSGPAFSVFGNKLRIDNARHGFFNTPLHKTVVIEGLNIKFLCHSEAEGGQEQAQGDGTTSCYPGESGCSASIVGSVVADDVRSEVGPGAKPVYRFWSPVNESCFYTLDVSERDKLLSEHSGVWAYRGVAYYRYPHDSPSSDRNAVFRFWSAGRRQHRYTNDIVERDRLINSDLWAYEGIAWYGDRGMWRDEIRNDNGMETSPTMLGVSETAIAAGDPQMMAEALEGLRRIEDRFMNASIEMNFESPLFDIKRASKIIVRDLDYRVFQDGRLDLGVKCKKAVMSYSTSEILLQGCVTITGQDGRELMSNRVVWNIDRNCYDVPGMYVLRRNGSAVRGRGVHCDSRLNVLRKDRPLLSTGKLLRGRSRLAAAEHRHSRKYQTE